MTETPKQAPPDELRMRPSQWSPTRIGVRRLPSTIFRTLFAAFKQPHRGGSHGPAGRRRFFFGLGAAWMEKDDHAVNLPARIQKIGRADACRRQGRAFPGTHKPIAKAVPGAIDFHEMARSRPQTRTEHLRVSKLLDCFATCRRPKTVRSSGTACGVSRTIISPCSRRSYTGEIDNHKTGRPGAEVPGGFR